MGRKLNLVESRIEVALRESMSRLDGWKHAKDSYERGYAMALQDVKFIIEAIK